MEKIRALFCYFKLELEQVAEAFVKRKIIMQVPFASALQLLNFQ